MPIAIRSMGIASSWDCSRADGVDINHKRIERIWREKGYNSPSEQPTNDAMVKVAM
jgi:hypothetical protein